MPTPTRGEVFDKLLHHMREAQSCMAIMAHLHNTEGNPVDASLARGWLLMEELCRKMIAKLTLLAQGRLQ